MTTPAPPLARELVSHLVLHLDEQLRSVVRLRAAVEELGVAIRARDVAAVLRHTGTLEAESTFRTTLEERRTALLQRGAAMLGVEPWEVSVTGLCSLVDPQQALLARERSDELLAAMEEVAREHRTNRTLMQQELSFLDHLMHLGGVPAEPTYEPPGEGRRVVGSSAPGSAANVALHRHGLDLRA
ncbi:hypothetical protein [Patulibacter minatonensis]|uniref:hypothetical protein n=1 Tax=Patulibacter minatonensis TaxID=298163 RepID=UPI0004791012|nr:hypothetical protein [Patulibacter minatonensis]